MKKVFYIVFAFYFLGLSLIPCEDEKGCNEEISTTQTAQNGHHDHEDETCSPFCICSCCASPILHTDANTTKTIICEIAAIYTPSGSRKLPTTVSPIWQPPKFG